MNRPEAVETFTRARSARFATITPEDQPHIVPITFAFIDDRIVTMVDHKPKTTERLQRLTNIEHNPQVSLLADHYSEDWDELWWVRVDGKAELHHEGELWEEAREVLAAKYDQYRDRRPKGPAIVIAVDRVTAWSSIP